MNWWVPTNGGGWKVDKWGDSASNGIYGDFQGTRGDKLEIQWGACMEVSHSFQHSSEPNFELEAGFVLDFKKCYWIGQKVFNYQFTDTYPYRRQTNRHFGQECHTLAMCCTLEADVSQKCEVLHIRHRRAQQNVANSAGAAAARLENATCVAYL